MHHTIGDEFTWAREGMAELLCEDGLEVREVTTDPDSSAGRAADSLYKDGLLGQNFSIPSSDENETMLHACFSKRLSPAVLDKTIKNSNSQKVESFNRTLRRSLPRNVTFTRNFAGRAHSAAHSCNNGPGSSLRGLCAGVGASIPSGGQVDQTLCMCMKFEPRDFSVTDSVTISMMPSNCQHRCNME